MIRGLTEGERALAIETFGEALRLDTIRILPTPFPRAFVPGRWFGFDWILWPARDLPTDFAEAALRLQGVLIHELVHVWQAQKGIGLLLGKIRAGDGPAAYAYPLAPDCDWERLNIEQQAMVVEHRFLLSRGARVPADQAFYDRVCPLARRMEI